MQALLKPRTIAVLGASERSVSGRGIMQSLDSLGFAGPVYPVNPRYPTVSGKTCYPSLRDLPSKPDLIAYCVPNAAILENLKVQAELGIGGAVLYDGGFAEAGPEGKKLQSDIAGICAEAGIALCGPNCMGVMTPPLRASVFRQNVRDPERLMGNVALISQSGSIAASLLVDLRRFGFSFVASSGNEAVTTTAQYIEYAADDPNTKVIATFTETVHQPEQYVAALDKAAKAGKPVIVIKVGRNERTARAITSHTGGLAGESRVFSELLKAHRAIEVTEMDEMGELLSVCQGKRWPKGRRINVVSSSGGQAELILDIAMSCGYALDPLPQAAREKIEADVGHISGDGNPLDAWGAGDFKVAMPAALKILSENEGTDAIVFCSSDSMDNQALGRPGREEQYAEMFAVEAEKSTKPHYLTTTRPGVMHTGQAKILAKAGVPVIGGFRQGLGAIDKLARWGATPPATRAAAKLAPSPELAASKRSLNEYDAKKLLASCGVPVTKETLVEKPADLPKAAAAMGYPVVLKVASDAIPHKTEHGLVAVGLRDEAALTAAAAKMEKTVATLGKPIKGYLVQEMVSDGVEVFAGVSRDPLYGLALAFGMGGVAIEVTRDFALRMLPLRQGDAEAMIAETKGAALLAPHRGKPGADIGALAKCLYALSDFVTANADRIAEIDLNPIKAGPDRCVVVDALIVTR